MAGHSKWANIKFRKSTQDAKRGKLFTKLIREITTASRQGGDDPGANPRLRTAIDKALDANMTRDTIDRAIKRGCGSLDDEKMEAICYEGYGPGGAAIMVECLTDNRNRTVSEVRHLFNKYGGNLGTDGSVSYLFNNLGQIEFEPGASEDKIMEIALEAGAEDIIIAEDTSIEVHTQPEHFQTVKEALIKAGLMPVRAEIAQLPTTTAHLDKETAERFIKLVDLLEDLDDVQSVHSNAEIDDEHLADWA